jgi:hypothetical protein
MNQWIIIGSGGNEYILTADLNGNISCQCLGFVNYEKCYHSSYIKDCIANKVKPKKIIRRSIKIFD